MAVGTLDKTIFDDLLKDHKAQLSADVELEETDIKMKEVINKTNSRIAAIEVETEEIKRQRQEGGQDEKVGEPEKIESSKKEKKNDSAKKIEKDPALGKNFEKPTEILDPKEQAFRDARKLYVETEFDERKKLDELRSFFGRNFGDSDKTETHNIRSAKEAYEKILKERMYDQIAELESRGLEGKALNSEVEKLLTYYRSTASLELFNARTDYKIEKKKETEGKSGLKRTWDRVSVKMDQIANWYNKEVPLAVKGGLAVGSFLAGAGLFTSGKRLWSAFVMATTGGMQLDAAAQFVDKYAVNKKNKKNIKEVSKENGKVDFERLRDILDDRIEDIDRKVNLHVMRSYLNKTLAFTFATMFGVQALEGIGHAFEKMSAVPVDSVVPSDITGDKILPVPDELKGESTPFVNASSAHGLAPASAGAAVAATEHGAGSMGVPKFEMNPSTHQEIMHAPGKDIVKISVPDHTGEHVRHDSFARSFKDYIKGSGKFSEAELKHVTNSAFNESIREYADNHGISYEQAIHKLSRIHPGTTYEVTWDEHGTPHMHIKDVNFMKAVKHVRHAVHHAPSGLREAIADNASVENVPQGDITTDLDGYKQEVSSRISQLSAEESAINHDIENDRAGWGSNEMIARNGGFVGQSGFGELNKKAVDHLMGMKAHSAGVHSKLTELMAEKGYLENPNFKGELGSFRKEIFGKNVDLFKQSQNMPMSEIKSPDALKDFTDKLPKDGKAILKATLRAKPAKGSETLAKWTIRVVEEWDKARDAVAAQ